MPEEIEDHENDTTYASGELNNTISKNEMTLTALENAELKQQNKNLRKQVIHLQDQIEILHDEKFKLEEKFSSENTALSVFLDLKLSNFLESTKTEISEKMLKLTNDVQQIQDTLRCDKKKSFDNKSTKSTKTTDIGANQGYEKVTANNTGVKSASPKQPMLPEKNCSLPSSSIIKESNLWQSGPKQSKIQDEVIKSLTIKDYETKQDHSKLMLNNTSSKDDDWSIAGKKKHKNPMMKSNSR
ncbi:hypothetical protein Zmor_025203 [Zophobas morio]|uniref:Uncharacterized protein n=1 Tax=Zophobas morio TaxID=2755281 RepID=A0AA38M3V4_9CUCU|nr:hypothetical protein Zmor_025203 [Zophobas morio]